MKKVNIILLLVPLLVLLWGVAGGGQYEWQVRDAFDEIREKLYKVTEDNCFSSHLEDIYLPEDTVSHYPDVQEFNIHPVFSNRTAMLYLHKIAMARAFFWSYILQSRFINPAVNDTSDPGMMYYFLSSVADVSASPYINASAAYFSPNTAYTSSYPGFFNETMSRFAPRATRLSGIKDPSNQTVNIFNVEDLGAFEHDSLSKDYTHENYRINEWYQLWLPDIKKDTKTTYQVEITYADNKNKIITLYGPPANDEIPGPVKWSKPYFDCGRTNKWLVAAVSPVVDIYPRATQLRQMEYSTYTAAVVMEMDFNRIDINQCPPSQGNDQPNRFASTARCKNSTKCEPIHGSGFRRGGYQCRCDPKTCSSSQACRSYHGEDIEQATSDQYVNNFDCKHEINKTDEGLSATTEPTFLTTDRSNLFIKGIQAANCSKFNPSDLFLNGTVSWGEEYKLENQAMMAISDPQEEFSGTRLTDKPLTEDQMIAETLAILFGDSKIWSAGIYWDRNTFTGRTFFAPFAFKTEVSTRKFKLEDLAQTRETNYLEYYTNKPWFQFPKQRWSTDLDDLEKFYIKMRFRDNEIGQHLKRFERYPTYYKAANLTHEHWTRPYYACDGHLKGTVITYASPFFGWDSSRVKLEFKGVVAVTMPLNL